jgi:hypothetical protein
MDYKEKVKEKNAAYKVAGFKCSDIVERDDVVYFFSEKDGLKRKHSFSQNEMTVDIVEDVPAETGVVKEVVVEAKPKKTNKKKKGE